MKNRKGKTFTTKRRLILSHGMAVEILCCARAGDDMYLACLATCSETDQPRNPAASIWFKTNEEIHVLPMKTLQSQNILLFRYQKVNQNQQFAFIA